MIILDIPYPPSVNTYWGFSGHRRFLTPKAVTFKHEVWRIAKQCKAPQLEDARLEVTITLHAPDKRVRDIDNVVKSTLDALCQANLFLDDSQIDVLLVMRGEPVKGGKAVVMIEVLPK